MPVLLNVDDSRPIQLQTRAGRDIENSQEKEYTAHRREMEEGNLRTAFPFQVAQSTKRRDASAMYNCHGMTFASRRTAITEERVVKQILKDDGYREVLINDLLPGDVVLYYEEGGLSHSGVVVNAVEVFNNFEVRVLSKWGRYDEFIHDLRVHPYPDIVSMRFYRDQSDAN